MRFFAVIFKHCELGLEAISKDAVESNVGKSIK